MKLFFSNVPSMEARGIWRFEIVRNDVSFIGVPLAIVELNGFYGICHGRLLSVLPLLIGLDVEDEEVNVEVKKVDWAGIGSQ